MTRTEKLRKEVDRLYQLKGRGRDDWADWLYEHHVFLVVNIAEKLAKRYGADIELSVAAAMLHDVADATMRRDNLHHEEESAAIARRLLKFSGFDDKEVKIIVDDALRLHGCHGSERPKTLEGKVLAASDGTAHLQSDFYEHALGEKKKGESMEDISKWAVARIERDFHNKIVFHDLQDEVRVDYERLRQKFISLR